MKLRILGNSLRLRLSMPEVEAISKNGMVSDRIGFGDRELIYTLAFSGTERIIAGFSGDQIKVEVPEKAGKQWADSDQVGLESEQFTGTESALFILIEKDFACLKPRQGEDQSQLFPNPDSGS